MRSVVHPRTTTASQRRREKRPNIVIETGDANTGIKRKRRPVSTGFRDRYFQDEIALYRGPKRVDRESLFRHDCRPMVGHVRSLVNSKTLRDCRPCRDKTVPTHDRVTARDNTGHAPVAGVKYSWRERARRENARADVERLKCFCFFFLSHKADTTDPKNFIRFVSDHNPTAKSTSESIYTYTTLLRYVVLNAVQTVSQPVTVGNHRVVLNLPSLWVVSIY